MLRRRLLCFNDDAKSFIIYSRIERTNANLNTIRNGIDATIEQLDPDHTGNPDLGESYIEMLNGCDIGKCDYQITNSLYTRFRVYIFRPYTPYFASMINAKVQNS